MNTPYMISHISSRLKSISTLMTMLYLATISSYTVPQLEREHHIEDQNSQRLDIQILKIYFYMYIYIGAAVTIMATTIGSSCWLDSNKNYTQMGGGGEGGAPLKLGFLVATQTAPREPGM